MTNAGLFTCDGCGQLADAEHVARRLRRLEWATRYRPVHIQALMLGGVAPRLDSECLYAPETEFQGDAGKILRAAGVSWERKPHEAVVTEFQKLGVMLAYVLECPLNEGAEASQGHGMLEKQLPATLARIRRSLQPKRVVLFSAEVGEVADTVRRAELGCLVLPRQGAPFLSSLNRDEEQIRAFREALWGPAKA